MAGTWRYLSPYRGTLRYMATKNMNLRLSEELLARVDVARGDVPRSVWIRRAIESGLGLQVRTMSAETALRVADGAAPAPGRMGLDERGRISSFEGTYAPSLERVDASRIPERQMSRTEAFRRATQK